MPDKAILLVEDNPDHAELAKIALRENRVLNRIIWAENGREALDYLEGTGNYAGRDLQDIPALVRLDLHLPKISGMEVLRLLRREPRTAQVLVVVFSASRNEQELMQTYNLGGNSCLRKPTDPADMAAVLR
ncbi:MAG: response regulator [Deltaproteobacteria bacterium]|nr:response regulator [Deltaproteobacteria bacterium]